MVIIANFSSIQWAPRSCLFRQVGAITNFRRARCTFRKKLRLNDLSPDAFLVRYWPSHTYKDRVRFNLDSDILITVWVESNAPYMKALRWAHYGQGYIFSLYGYPAVS